tara:strand:- start:417 stop:692 length:276 start_codon:yes stop_codon:yes gene_type:complete
MYETKIMMKTMTIIFTAAFLIFINNEFREFKKRPIASPKGILVSTLQLSHIKEMATSGIEPHSTNVTLFLKYIDSLMQASLAWPPLEKMLL